MTEKHPHPLTRIGTGIVGLMVVFLILVAVNVILQNLRLRTDLTQEQLYSLSAGSISTLRKLERPVTLKLFFNRTNPAVPAGLKAYARQVEDLLREYELAARGRVTVETYDPRMDSEDEEWARKYGLPGQQLEMFGPSLYFGLVAVSGGEEAALPALDPRMQHLLEFNITRLIHTVTNPHKPMVGVFSSLPVLGRQPGFAMPGQPQPQPKPAWFAFEDLKQLADLQEIEALDEGVPPGLDVLIVVHPKHLEPREVFAIDQYVLGAGRLILLLDPMAFSDDSAAQASPFGRPDMSSDLPDLLAAWGVGYDPGTVVADMAAGTPMRTGNNQIERSPVVLTYGRDHMNAQEITTAGLETIRLAFAGVLTDLTDNALTVTPLITTSPDAMLADAMLLQMGPEALRRESRPAGGPQSVALRLAGTFRTAFPDGRPPDDPADDDAGSPDALSEGQSVVAIIADVDMLHNDVCVEEINFFGQRAYRPLTENLVFFANLVEQMSGSEDLISIRSRGVFNRPFTRVDAIERQALARWQETEAELESRLRTTQQRLRELQQAESEDQRFLLTDRQRREIESFRQEEFRLRQNLQEVRRNLNREIEALGLRLKALNIALMPALVAAIGIVVGLYRSRRN